MTPLRSRYCGVATCPCLLIIARVLVEQLTSECDRLNGSMGQAEMALQYSIQERLELQELLLLARRFVQQN